MDAREHRVSRRALLGAACALPLVRHPGLDPGSPFLAQALQDRGIPGRARNDEKWRSALARFRNAEAALATVQGADDIVFDRVLGRFNHALRRLIRAPAPNPAAFSAKLALAIDQEIWELTGGEACLAALKRDAQRLYRRA